MARRNEEPDDESDDKHPALKNFSRIAYQAKHVIGGGFTGGLIGAGVGAAGAAALSFAGVALTGTALMAIPIVGPIIALLGGGAAVATGAAGAALGSVVTTGALYGAGIGAAGGALLKMTSAGEAADAEEDKIINKYEQARAREERLGRLREARDRQKIAMERQDIAMRGQNPNRGLPRGRDAMPDGAALT